MLLKVNGWSIYIFIQLAQTVVDAGAIAHLAQMILNPDSKLKVSVMKIITSFSKKNRPLSKMAAENSNKVKLA